MDELPFPEIEKVCDVLYGAYKRDSSVYLFGNGGSAALASHLACDLGKGTFAPHHVPLPGVKRFRVLSLADNGPMITAWANDSSYQNIFAEQLANFVQPNDVAFGISGSGNSSNVLLAMDVARAAKAITVGLTGFQGGKLGNMVDHPIIVPADNIQHVEDMHLVIGHIVFLTLQSRICEGAEKPAKQSSVLAKP
jgi:D-sedoheptulose 7-phosphate isomerase